MKFQAVTDQNRKINLNWDLLNQYVFRWKPGTPLEISITRKEPKVSSPQRRYYFGVVLPALMDGLGYDPEEDELVHRQLKIVFFNVKPDKRGIYREKDIPSVFSDESDIGIATRIKFMDWVMRKCAENGVYVPAPDERDNSKA